MSNHGNLRVAVIGAGISGLAAAKVLKQNGFDPVVFEKSEKVGGVWALAYPGIRLQNIASQYHFSDFPWPFAPDLHPSGTQILQYLDAASEHFQLDVRLRHQILSLEEQENGWVVNYRNREGEQRESFGYVVVSTGQYTDGKHRPQFPGEEQFQGEIITERDMRALEKLDGKRVAVVGFGKSALDMATFAAERSQEVRHVFRTPRWTLPEWILGAHFTYALFNRFGTVMMPGWEHPTAVERFLHHQLRFVVDGFWNLISTVFRYQIERNGSGKDQAARQRLKTVLPTHPLVPDLRSAAALAPERYYPYVAEGRILPVHAALEGFSENGMRLKGGQTIDCDLVILSLGSQTPSFPFLPEKYRQRLEAEADGAQLYRHLIQPGVPRLGFAGFNHGYMHIPAVEVGTLWLAAYWRGELELPPVEAMEKDIEHIRQWKREHIHFEPSRSCAINTRFQQYLDILLQDLGLSPYRKLPNPLAEIFGRYNAADYRNVLTEYQHKNRERSLPLRSLPEQV